jgi:hypothetical protein
MANTYQIIASNTLGTAAASVTFSSIPSTYTDLLLKFSARGAASFTGLNLIVTLNSTSSGYSNTRLYGTGSATASDRASSAIEFNIDASVPGVLGTSNTFNSGEIYIPNYAGSTNKPNSIFVTPERNNTDSTMSAVAGLWSNTAAINTIAFALNSGNFAVGTSFFLYGIKNS